LIERFRSPRDACVDSWRSSTPTPRIPSGLNRWIARPRDVKDIPSAQTDAVGPGHVAVEPHPPRIECVWLVEVAHEQKQRLDVVMPEPLQAQAQPEESHSRPDSFIRSARSARTYDEARLPPFFGGRFREPGSAVPKRVEIAIGLTCTKSRRSLWLCGGGRTNTTRPITTAVRYKLAGRIDRIGSQCRRIG